MTTPSRIKPSQSNETLMTIERKRNEMEKRFEQDLLSFYRAFGVMPTDIGMNIIDTSTVEGPDCHFDVRIRVEI